MDYRDNAIDAIREALAEQPAQQQAYEQANPLGGPAKVFQAMADAIRAGDDYHSVLRQYGYAEAQQQEPVLWQILNGVCHAGVRSTENLAKEAAAGMQKTHDLAGSLAAFHVRPLYGQLPASKPWVGLTEDEIDAVDEANWDEDHKAWGIREFARAIEAKLREKNERGLT